MTLGLKRDLVEVLMCASDERTLGITAVATYDLGTDGSVSEMACRLRVQAEPSCSLEYYEESCVEAAYRLIETSPTLRREWWGVP